MKKPDFIIVGSMKGGTSTLAHYLSHHKDIIMAPGELNFFDNNKNYSKGKSWYLSKFKSSDNSKFWGEKTATYHYDEKVPERIYQYNPEIKLIWIFRNPVDRAYSNYWHRVKYGGESKSFEIAVKEELAGVYRNKWCMYLDRSNYIKQVNLYLKYFKKNQMFFMIFEDLIKHPLQELLLLFRFLDIESYEEYEITNESKNLTHLPRSKKVLRISKLLFGKSLPFKIMRKLNEKRIPGYPKLDQEFRKQLQSHFSKNYDELEGLINRDLDTWN